MDNAYVILTALALITYATRIGGHVVLSRFKTIHPRVEAALEAVPAAVLTTIAVPAAVTSGPAEMLAMCVALIACLRFSPVIVLIIGIGTLVFLRNFIF